MSSKSTALLGNDTQALLSEVRIELSQLLERYQVTEALTIHLPDYTHQSPNSAIHCEFINGYLICPFVLKSAQSLLENSSETNLGLTSEEMQQLSEEVSSRLEVLVPQLSQSVEQVENISEVRLTISPDSTRPGYPAPCHLADGIIVCKLDSCS